MVNRRIRNKIRTFPLTAKKASVLATTIAALDETPPPEGTEPVTNISADTGFSESSFKSVLAFGKYCESTPYKRISETLTQNQK